MQRDQNGRRYFIRPPRNKGGGFLLNLPMPASVGGSGSVGSVQREIVYVEIPKPVYYPVAASSSPGFTRIEAQQLLQEPSPAIIREQAAEEEEEMMEVAAARATEAAMTGDTGAAIAEIENMKNQAIQQHRAEANAMLRSSAMVEQKLRMEVTALQSQLTAEIEKRKKLETEQPDDDSAAPKETKKKKKKSGSGGGAKEEDEEKDSEKTSSGGNADEERLEKENASLKQALAQQSAAYTELEQRYRGYMDEVDARMNAARDEKRALQNTVNELRATLASAAAEMNPKEVSRNVIDELTREKDNFREKVEQLSNQNSALSRSIQEEKMKTSQLSLLVSSERDQSGKTVEAARQSELKARELLNEATRKQNEAVAELADYKQRASESIQNEVDRITAINVAELDKYKADRALVNEWYYELMKLNNSPMEPEDIKKMPQRDMLQQILDIYIYFKRWIIEISKRLHLFFNSNPTEQQNINLYIEYFNFIIEDLSPRSFNDRVANYRVDRNPDITSELLLMRLDNVLSWIVDQASLKGNTDALNEVNKIRQETATNIQSAHGERDRAIQDAKSADQKAADAKKEAADANQKADAANKKFLAAEKQVEDAKKEADDATKELNDLKSQLLAKESALKLKYEEQLDKLAEKESNIDSEYAERKTINEDLKKKISDILMKNDPNYDSSQYESLPKKIEEFGKIVDTYIKWIKIVSGCLYDLLSPDCGADKNVSQYMYTINKFDSLLATTPLDKCLQIYNPGLPVESQIQISKLTMNDLQSELNKRIIECVLISNESHLTELSTQLPTLSADKKSPDQTAIPYPSSTPVSDDNSSTVNDKAELVKITTELDLYKQIFGSVITDETSGVYKKEYIRTYELLTGLCKVIAGDDSEWVTVINKTKETYNLKDLMDILNTFLTQVISDIKTIYIHNLNDSINRYNSSNKKLNSLREIHGVIINIINKLITENTSLNELNDTHKKLIIEYKNYKSDVQSKANAIIGVLNKYIAPDKKCEFPYNNNQSEILNLIDIKNCCEQFLGDFKTKLEGIASDGKSKHINIDYVVDYVKDLNSEYGKLRFGKQ